jgi:hypothetical protein
VLCVVCCVRCVCRVACMCVCRVYLGEHEIAGVHARSLFCVVLQIDVIYGFIIGVTAVVCNTAHII